MSDLSFGDRMRLEKLLRMSAGYVLDFSNSELQDFVGESVGLDILDEKYKVGTGSKAKRLRAFWKLEPNNVVGKLLVDLVDFVRRNHYEDSPALINECEEIANEMLGAASSDDAGPLIFISYARPDLNAVEGLVGLLLDARLRTWFDKKDLLGGQDWEWEIRRHIAEASLVLVCLSARSVDRKGFFHREMRLAVDEALKLPQGRIFILPVRLDECEIPDDLRRWHTIDLFAPNASRVVLKSIGRALDCGARARSEAHESFDRTIREYDKDG